MDDIDIIALMQSIEAGWEIREERLEHDHIFQKDNGVPGCIACETINPERMTINYVRKAKYAVGGGWA
jgi:hypothetical protein